MALLPKGLVGFVTQRSVPVVLQAENAECSLACLAMIAGYHGRQLSIAEIRKLFSVSLRGISLRTLLDIASMLGLTYRAIRAEVSALRKVALPAILHWDLDHFVVLTGCSRRKFVIHDPVCGVRQLGVDEFSDHFTGIVVELAPGETFERAKRQARLTVSTLIGSVRGFYRAIFQIILLSVILESLLLLQPALMRASLDQGLANKDYVFTREVIAYLAFVGVLHAGFAFLRDYAVLRAGATLSRRMFEGVFHHCLKLPLDFFEKRQIGHLTERHRILDDVERFLVTTLPLGVVDGVMSLASLFIVILIWPTLVALSLGTVVCFLVFVLARYGAHRSRELSYQYARTSERAHLVETYRSIFTIKANGIESTRYLAWSGLLSRVVTEREKFNTTTLTTGAVKGGLLGLNLAMFVWLATRQLQTAGTGLGTMFAALVYNMNFIARSLVLVERFLEYRLLNVKLEGLEDLALAEQEDARLLSPTATRARAPVGVGGEHALEKGFSLSVQDVDYNYGQASEDILKGLNLDVSPGEMVALVGQNGSGKTTLVKLLTGLYLPTRGRVRINDSWSNERGFFLLRSRIGTVTQDDQLLQGTMAQNIANFELEPDEQRVIMAAEAACVHADIERMPMGYLTRVGDIGSPISEGQKQKVFLARAFYKQPRLLILDEGTSNIDAESEARILRNLAAMPATKILIAHHPESIQGATRVFAMANGKLSELRGHAAPVIDVPLAVTGS